VRIIALALSAQAGSVVPVDAAGAPLAPMITWLDRRAEPIVAAWQADGAAARIRAISGWHPYPGLPIATIAWLGRHAPQVASRARRYLGAHELLVQHLTGRCVTDLSEGAEMLLLDQATGGWSVELCELAGIRVDQLADLAQAGTVVGPLLPAVAAATGLPPDLQVVVGGHDQCCAALGMGVTAPGELMLATGTAWVLTALASKTPVAQIPAGMELNYHVTPQVYTVSQLLGGFGATVEWWLEILLQPLAPGPARYALFDEWLATSQPGAHGLHFLPLGGSAQTGGASPGGFVGLRLDHTRADMARAICEGVACEVRWAFDNLAAAGLPSQRMWMSGGATHSPLWPSILADVAGIPLYVARGSNWPARGAAILAGAGCGQLGDLPEATVRWRPGLAHLAPDPVSGALYAARYAAHRQAVETLSARRA
jgi:sugar (pentulose or hexulose) kinase